MVPITRENTGELGWAGSTGVLLIPRHMEIAREFNNGPHRSPNDGKRVGMILPIHCLTDSSTGPIIKIAWAFLMII